MGPYIGLGFVLIAIALVFAIQKSPKIVEEYPSGDLEGQRPLKILLSNKHYVFGVVAQFFNVAAQVCAWTFLIQYSQQALGGSLQLGGFLLQISLIVFLISRFIMTWVIGRVRATAVLAVLGVLAVILCIFAMFSPNMAGVVALVAVSFCLSLMFPTIYGVALQGLGPATKFGAAGLVMAIVGGAIMPLIQGRLLDATSPAISFIVPAVCFAVVDRLRHLRSESRTPHGWRTSMKRYWIITLALIVAACGGGGQKANFSEATDRLEVVSWWVSPSEHPAFEVLLNAFKAANPNVECDRWCHRRGRWEQRPGRARCPSAGRRSSRCVADVPGQFASRVGRRRAASLMCPPCTNARAWIAPCRRRCSTQRPIGSRRGGCRQGHTAEMFCGSTSGSCVRPALLFPVPATPAEAFGNDWPKWRQAVKRRCALAAKTGSPRRSCSRTLCWG